MRDVAPGLSSPRTCVKPARPSVSSPSQPRCQSDAEPASASEPGAADGAATGGRIIARLRRKSVSVRMQARSAFRACLDMAPCACASHRLLRIVWHSAGPDALSNARFRPIAAAWAAHYTSTFMSGRLPRVSDTCTQYTTRGGKLTAWNGTAGDVASEERRRDPDL